MAPVLLMRSEPARSQRVSLPMVRTPVDESVAATWMMSRQCERLEWALMSWQPTARCSKPLSIMDSICSGDVTPAYTYVTSRMIARRGITMCGDRSSHVVLQSLNPAAAASAPGLSSDRFLHRGMWRSWVWISWGQQPVLRGREAYRFG